MGVKISNLPIIVTPALSDVFPVVQGSVTYKESFTQLSSLFATSGANSNITSMTGVSSITFNPTTGGIVGTTTNDDAGAGFVGQFASNVVLGGSAVSVTTATPLDLASISLTAGDWDVWGNASFIFPAATSYTVLLSWISSTSATLPDGSLITAFMTPATVLGAGASVGSIPPSRRFSLAGTTTIYLTVQANFTVSTLTCCGGIYARRRR